MDPPPEEERNSYLDNDQFEKFFQEFYKKVSEEVHAHECTTSDDDYEDNPMKFHTIRKLEVAQSHTMQENLAGPSTSTQRPDKASVAATPDEDYPMRAPDAGKVEVCTGEDNEQDFAGPSTSTQRPDKASVAATPDEDYPMRAPDAGKVEVCTGEDNEQDFAGPSTSTQRPDKASVAATPDEDYPMRAPDAGKVEVCTGEDNEQDFAGPSTSTQRPDKASVAATPDEDYPMRAPDAGKVEVCTGEDNEQDFAGPSTSTQRPASYTPTLPTEQYDTIQRQAVKSIRKCINIQPGQCKVVFVEEGTFVPPSDSNDRVLRFMRPNNFWNKMQIGPPRKNSKFHFYLVVQEDIPATEPTNNYVTKFQTCNVMVAIRQAMLRKDGLSHIRNLAQLSVSQYLSAVYENPVLQSISWENSTANDPIPCEVMCIEKISFNPFTRHGRIKSDNLWKEITTYLEATTATTPTEEPTTKGPHNHELEDDLKPSPTSTPLTKKKCFEAACDNHHDDKPDFLVISKFVYVIPRITYKQLNQKGDGFQPKLEPTNPSGNTVSEAVSEPEEDFKIPEISIIQDQLQTSVSGFNFAENQLVEIPYLSLATSSEKADDDSALRKLAEIALQMNKTTDIGL